MREGWSVAIAGSRVAAVGRDLGGLAGSGTKLIDVQGRLVVPGLIEPHSHLTRIGIHETARLQVAAGITTTVLETTEVGLSTGLEGVRAMLKEARHAQGRILFTISPMIGLDQGHDAALEPSGAWISLLDEPGVVGVGEAFWADLLRGHSRAMALNAAACARGLAVEGHGAGAKHEVLVAMQAAGVGSDHEATNAGEALVRLRLGLYVYLRHGVTRQDLTALSELWRHGQVPLDRLAFCTDGVDPESLMAGRSLNFVLAAAIRTGLPLLDAVGMGTLGPARRFGLDPWLGTFQVGALADVAVYDDESFEKPSLVLVDGATSFPKGPSSLPGWLFHTLSMGKLDPAAFVPLARGRYRAIEIVPEAPLVTREFETSGENALLAVAIDRLGSGVTFRGLVAGLGITSGAIATTTGGESCALLVIGDNAPDMVRAVERVISMEGGVAVHGGGRELAAWAAPIAGMLSPDGAAGVAHDVARVNAALRALGCRLPDPLTAIDFLTSPAVPHLRICASGYVRLRDGRRLGLDWTD